MPVSTRGQLRARARAGPSPAGSTGERQVTHKRLLWPHHSRCFYGQDRDSLGQPAQGARTGAMATGHGPCGRTPSCGQQGGESSPDPGPEERGHVPSLTPRSPGCTTPSGSACAFSDQSKAIAVNRAGLICLRTAASPQSSVSAPARGVGGVGQGGCLTSQRHVVAEARGRRPTLLRWQRLICGGDCRPRARDFLPGSR